MHDDHFHARRPDQESPGFGSRTAMPVHDAGALTGPTGQARILLDGRPYTLRITRARKLLLTRAEST